MSVGRTITVGPTATKVAPLAERLLPKGSTIMVIGSGPIVIGQACEFDYSGTQACKVLKALGYRVVLINSNPATIMTDESLADATYVEPLTLEFAAQVVAKERPQALLPTADEVAAGSVNHALRFILPNARMKRQVYVRPATHAGAPSSANADAPPYGVRFRLKPTFDETPYNANARVILRALKTHGMILSDGGNIALTFADDRLSAAKWSSLGIPPQTFNSIRVTDFEVVDLGAEIPLTFNCVRAP